LLALGAYALALGAGAPRIYGKDKHTLTANEKSDILVEKPIICDRSEAAQLRGVILQRRTGSTLKLRSDRVALAARVPLNIEHIRLATDLAVFHVLLPSAR
jgi:hypothetical protein